MSAVAKIDDDMFETVDADRLKAQEEMEAMHAARRAKKRTSISIGNKGWSRTVEETAKMMQTGEWEGATGRHFSALFTILFHRVYKVDADMTSQDRAWAAGLANKMLREKFSDNAGEMAGFMRWCWQREESREKWRRDNSQSGSVMSWRWQFNTKLYTEWRVDMMRHKA
jgi:hypothetical protein